MELFPNVLIVQVVDLAPPRQVKGKHYGYEETIISHDGYCPEDESGREEDGVAEVEEEMLLLA